MIFAPDGGRLVAPARDRSRDSLPTSNPSTAGSPPDRLDGARSSNLSGYAREGASKVVMRRLLIVEEAHPSGATGVVLSPRFVSEEALPRAFSVRLKLPGGAERVVAAQVQLSHVRGPSNPFGLLRLPDLVPADVPPGTEVWLDE